MEWNIHAPRRTRFWTHHMSRTEGALNTLTEGSLGSLPTKILQLGATGATIEVAVKGATLLSWRAPFKGVHGDLVAGFVSEEDFDSQAGMRNGLLFPFANRLRNNEYTWDGVTYTVPKQTEADPEVIHGFVRLNDWVFEGAELDNPEQAALTFSYEIREGQYDWYPFSLDVAVRFELTTSGLNVSFSYRNVGDVDLPAGFGWHPYFRLPGHETFNDLELKVPGRARIAMDEHLVPLAGDDAYIEREDDLVHATMEGVDYDDAWDRLVADEDGIIRTTLLEPDTRKGLEIWQDRGTVLIYTGGSFPVPRGSIAIEPVESTTDAFNRPDREHEVRLLPSQERVFRFGATIVD